MNTTKTKITGSFSEEDLVRGLRLQEERSYQMVYKLHFSQVNHFVIANNGSEDDARDVFQEALVVLYHKLGNPEFSLTCKVGTYLYSVSRFLWLKKIRQQNAHFVNRSEDWENSIPVEEDGEWMGREERLQQMEKALSGLGEPCKTLIEDFYINNLSMVEIADKFGYTNPDNAKTQKYKCMMRLKKLFFKDLSHAEHYEPKN